ncbi:Retrotransposon-derived protein PEG10 [Smittium culicis]|uniref:Retrotransposon-derived protein PEG10 n=1 Tax=Smittium culicis TaxID=133412 RepID=A0A1R1XLR3_9FUNG|nr:Retrotransposon-derived protein PEG10 [Smittium culicis]
MNRTPRDFFPQNQDPVVPNEQLNIGNDPHQDQEFPDIFQAIPNVPNNPGATFKLPDAPRFDGTVSSFTAFMSSMELFFWARPETFNVHRNRIVFIGTHLLGPAAIWFSSLIAASVSSNGTLPVLEDYGLFISELERNCSDPSHTIRIRGLIRKCRQGSRSAAAYAAEFRSFARDSGFDQAALIDQFMMGINENIMSYLMFTDLPDTLENIIEIVVRIDNRITTRNMIAQNHYTFRSSNPFRRNNPVPPVTYPVQPLAPVDTSTPMEICAVNSRPRGPLSAEEKTRRYEKGLCLYCGNTGHIAHQCPLKNSSGKGPAQQ